jgi:hypothetical protein
MSTDGYALAISEAGLDRAVAGMAGRCRDEPVERQQACAAKAIRQVVCVCVLSAPVILQALEDDLRGRVRGRS